MDAIAAKNAKTTGNTVSGYSQNGTFMGSYLSLYIIGG